MRRIFLDANIYFAAFHSPTGASALVAELVRRGKVRAVASRLVLREADRNLASKSGQKSLKAFRRFLQSVKLEIVPPPSEVFVRTCAAHIDPKDAPVLAAALMAKAERLLTLDERHFAPVKVAKLPGIILIQSPGEFLRDVVRKGNL